MRLINISTFTDKGGNLTVIEDFPFDVKRVFFLYGCEKSTRGEHRMKETRELVVCLQGHCKIYSEEESFKLDSPSQGLIIEPEDWRVIKGFSKDAVLIVFASTKFSNDDYQYSSE